MKDFINMGLDNALLDALRKMEFSEPTPIQEKTIPLALEGKDILGSAQTGTGKTAAFGIPLIEKLKRNKHGTALVMTPTRELAAQVREQLQLLLGKGSKIKSALLIGGEPMPKQLNQLRKWPRIIVGTPGRINDHLKRKSLSLKDTNFLVLDETDRMLDMGFTVQIETIIKFMPSKRQTLLFSATLPTNIAQIAEKYMNNPVRVSVSATSKPAANIKQETLKMSTEEKYPSLLTQLDEREGSVILFVRTKHGTERMATRLAKEGHSTNIIHGDLQQNKRSRVIAGFRNKNYRILVATDVAARGLDIPHIEHVINYDLPHCPEDYIHRIGRTARAGAEGSALNLVGPADNKKWREIDKLLNPQQEKTKKLQKLNNPKNPKNGKAATKTKKSESIKNTRFKSKAKKDGLKRDKNKVRKRRERSRRRA